VGRAHLTVAVVGVTLSLAAPAAAATGSAPPSCAAATTLLDAGQITAAETMAQQLAASPASATCAAGVLRNAIAARVARARALIAAGESDLAKAEITIASAEAPPVPPAGLRNLLRAEAGYARAAKLAADGHAQAAEDVTRHTQSAFHVPPPPDLAALAVEQHRKGLLNRLGDSTSSMGATLGSAVSSFTAAGLIALVLAVLIVYVLWLLIRSVWWPQVCFDGLTAAGDKGATLGPDFVGALRAEVSRVERDQPFGVDIAVPGEGPADNALSALASNSTASTVAAALQSILKMAGGFDYHVGGSLVSDPDPAAPSVTVTVARPRALYHRRLFATQHIGPTTAAGATPQGGDDYRTLVRPAAAWLSAVLAVHRANASPDLPHPSAMLEYAYGHEAYRAGDELAAARHYSRAVERDPRFGACVLNLGTMQSRIYAGDRNEELAEVAHANLSAVVDAEPGGALSVTRVDPLRALYARAVLRLNQAAVSRRPVPGARAMAVADLRRLCTALTHPPPDDAEVQGFAAAYTGVAKVALAGAIRADHPDQANQLVNDVFESGRLNYRILYNLACYYAAGDPVKAAECLQVALAQAGPALAAWAKVDPALRPLTSSRPAARQEPVRSAF